MSTVDHSGSVARSGNTGSTQDPVARLLEERAVERFIAREGCLADEARYAEWEQLWDTQALYWVPANDDHADPERQVSFIYDNRSRIASRVGQLMTGTRHAQTPASRMRRVTSGLEVATRADGTIDAAVNFILLEIRHGEQRLWGGRTLYHLVRDGDSFKMREKKVLLSDNAAPIRSLAFLV